MLIDMPYFMENADWYYFDYEEGKYKLTEKAPEAAEESYIEFYRELNAVHDNQQV